MSFSYGIELLDEGDWTTERLALALAGDLAKAQTPEGVSDPMLQRSLAGVLEIWSQQVLTTLLDGQIDALGAFAREISTLFTRFPKLPLARDLGPLERAGAQLDMLLTQIHCVQAIPARARVESLFAPEVRGADLRARIVQCLYGCERSGLSTPTLMEQTGASRQTLHLALQKLREHGLVVSDPLGPIHHHTLTVAGRQLWERIRPQSHTLEHVAKAAAFVAAGAVGGYLASHVGGGEPKSSPPVAAAKPIKIKKDTPRPTPAAP